VRLGKQSVESWNWFEFHFDPVFADNKEIIGICLSAVNINAQKQQVTTLAASEARLLAEMQSVLAITRAMVSEINVNSLLEFIMVQAEHLTDSEGAAVLLLSEDNQWLELATPDEVWRQIKSGLRLLAEGSLAELALASQQVQISNEAVADPRAASIRALLRSVQLNSILCAPLTVKEQNMGVLLVWNKRQQIFSDNDSRLMGLFADQAALAWHNARLHAQNRELAIEQERHRRARELHDSVTQSLYSIGIAAQASHRLLEQNKASDAETALQHIQRLAKTALAEMREKLYELRPTALAERGLVEILAEYCQMLSSQHALKINLEVAAEPTLSMYQQESLYYIIREALWNIVKYANTRQVKVVISSEPEYISLIILDEGLGFDVSILNQGETMGLRNMRERVKLLGGTFDIFSEIGQGTQILVKIPTHLPQTD
jgi:signal transduction histidine kinase